jgi:hypothetical protein
MKTLRTGWIVGIGALAAGMAGAQSGNGASWTDRLSLRGDLRVRYEAIDEEGRDGRERARFRARLALDARVNDEVDVGIGLATAENGDPVSSNVSLDNSASRKSVYLDLAWIRWRPVDVPGLSIVGGKMEMPFVLVRDLIWDHDMNPEGAAATYATKLDGTDLRVTVADFVFEERAAGSDTSMCGAQATAAFKLGEKAKLNIGVSDYYYDNMEGEAVMDFLTGGAPTGRSFGNSTTRTTEVAEDGSEEVTGVFYATGFNLVEGFALVELDLGIPVSLYGDYVVNTEADDEDTGYMVGLRIGKTAEPGSWELDVNYRDLEANAVVGAFTDSDSFGGGTDGEGFRISAGYQLSKNVKGVATYFINERSQTSGGIDYNRLQLDVSAKF